MRPLARLPFILIITLSFFGITQAEEGILILHVSDLAGMSITDVILTTTVNSSISAAELWS
jgi:hypothetical protein